PCPRPPLPAPPCVVLLPAAAAPHPYTLSLHDALPISRRRTRRRFPGRGARRSGAGRPVDAVAERREVVPEVLEVLQRGDGALVVDRKSTRLNSSHVKISYAVFCLKKKTNEKQRGRRQQ